MPNWTYNVITVTGPKEDRQRMLNEAEKFEGGKIMFSSWFPVPETFKKYDTTNHPNGEGLKVGEKWWDGLGGHDDQIVTEELIEEFKQATAEQKEKYGVVGWYAYNLNAFGCKWDCEVEITEHEGEVIMECDTPWSEPDSFLLRMSDKYPTLTFQCHADYEDGFWTEAVYEAGQGDKTDEGAIEYDENEEEEE